MKMLIQIRLLRIVLKFLHTLKFGTPEITSTEKKILQAQEV